VAAPSSLIPSLNSHDRVPTAQIEDCATGQGAAAGPGGTFGCPWFRDGVEMADEVYSARTKRRENMLAAALGLLAGALIGGVIFMIGRK
jgi:hypothetical protein